jgi:hypothetical protein
MRFGTASPYGLYACVPAMYLNKNDPTNFAVVRTFEPRYPNNVYGPSQIVSSPSVTTVMVYPADYKEQSEGLAPWKKGKITIFRSGNVNI